jgi:hypothetical protein
MTHNMVTWILSINDSSVSKEISEAELAIPVAGREGS